MVTDRYLVISADTHAGLPDAEYETFLDPQYRDAFRDDLRERTALRASAGVSQENEFVHDWYESNDEGLEGGWDAARRDKELDADGVVGEVIFPDADAVRGGASAPFGAGLGLSGMFDPELTMAGARAHNRWLAELCADSPDRRCGLAIVPILHDIDDAVAEIRRAHESGLRGILIPAMRRPYAPYNDARYDPSGRCARNSSCRSTPTPAPHPARRSARTSASTPTRRSCGPRGRSGSCCGPGCSSAIPACGSRRPKAGAGGRPTSCGRPTRTTLNEHATKKMGNFAPKLRMLPSEYFDRNVFIGSSNTRRREIANRFEIGVGNIMWGNDFPHPEGTWPHTREWLRETFWDCPVPDTRRILGENAAEVYGFDVAKLAPLVERIGPSPEDLGQTADVDLSKWDALEAAGRHWLTGREPVRVPVED